MWRFRRRSHDDFRPRDVLWFDELRQDVRYALRALSRSPGFAVVAILTLGLGIGANTAIFSVVNAVLLRPLPYRDPASLVLIETAPQTLAESWLTAAWRERAQTVSDLAGFNGPSPATLVAGGEPEQVQSAFVTWNFLSLLGVAPMAGRDFAEADAFPGAPPVALLSHGFWTARFSGDARSSDARSRSAALSSPWWVSCRPASGFLRPARCPLSRSSSPRSRMCCVWPRRRCG